MFSKNLFRFLAIILHCLIYVSCQQYKDVVVQQPVTNPSTPSNTISVYQNISRYEVFINGANMVIARSGGNIIISYPNLSESSSSSSEITLSPWNNDYQQINVILSGVFEYRAEVHDLNRMGSVIQESIFDQNQNEIFISDENAKKYKLNIVDQNNKTILAELYVNGQKPLSYQIINNYLQNARR